MSPGLEAPDRPPHRAAGAALPWPDIAAGLAVVGLAGLALWQALVIPASPIYAQVGPTAVPFAVVAGLLLLGAGLVYEALRGGWSRDLEEMRDAPPVNWRAFTVLLAGLAANVALIVPLGFSLAATAQFVLVAAAFALLLTLAVWFGFVEVLGVNIGAGVLEGMVLRALGREPAA